WQRIDHLASGAVGRYVVDRLLAGDVVFYLYHPDIARRRVPRDRVGDAWRLVAHRLRVSLGRVLQGSSTGAVALGAEEHQVVLVARVVQVEPVDAQPGVEAIALQALGRYVAEIVGIQQASHAEPAVEQHGAGSQHRV